MYVYVTVLDDVVKVLRVSCVFQLSYAFQAAASQSLYYCYLYNIQ